MKIAIISRSGPCFPNIISQGLMHSLKQLDNHVDIFYEGIPFLMRLLPLSKRPKRWHNNWHFRLRNKIIFYLKDKAFIKTLNNYDIIIISECYPNAFWKNYFAIEELRKLYKGKVVSYTEAPIEAAPANKLRHFDEDDYDETRFNYNLFVTDRMEIEWVLNEKQSKFGINLTYNKKLVPKTKTNFIAVVDFAQPGYENIRATQLAILKKLEIETIVLEGRYPIEEIQEIYRNAAIFFMAFPETFGLPIAECLACGTMIATPSSSWPMAWRINENPKSNEEGTLPSQCFKVYKNETDLEQMLIDLQQNFDFIETPLKVVREFKNVYSHFYNGNIEALKSMMKDF
jgi:hypothetical protein